MNYFYALNFWAVASLLITACTAIDICKQYNPSVDSGIGTPGEKLSADTESLRISSIKGTFANYDTQTEVLVKLEI